MRVTSLKALEISSISNSCSEGKAVVSGYDIKIKWKQQLLPVSNEPSK